MHRKINSLIAILIIAALAALAGGIFGSKLISNHQQPEEILPVNKKTQKEESANQKSLEHVQINNNETTTNDNPNSIIYTNTQFGFKLALPQIYSGHKVKISPLRDLDYCKDCYYIHFMMPTSDKEWLDQDDDTDEFFGYWPVFTIKADDTESYQKAEKECASGDKAMCYVAPLGKNSKYGFSFVAPSEGPPGFSALFFATQSEIIKNFQVL